MARKIIVLETGRHPKLHAKVVYWPTVPVANRAFYSNKVVAGQETCIHDASGPEITDIQNGVICEFVVEHEFEAGLTPANIRALLVENFNLIQNSLNDEQTYQFYGDYWDGSTWQT